MRQEKKTKAMFNRRYWLGLSLASAATLTAALISTGTVQAENKSIPDWASRREVGIYDPSVPDIEDDPTIFDDPGPIKVQEAPKSEFPNAFYDESGEFAFRVGLPGKSGVGGGIVAIMPGHYAIAVWSPRLNDKGNSYRGVKFLEGFTMQTQISVF